MREIKFIVIHCTATAKRATVQSIQNYWRSVLKWKNPGYHYIIDRFGNITQLCDDLAIANGVAGNNRNSIHVSYIGGLEKDDRTPAQMRAMLQTVRVLKQKYPAAEIRGHRDFPGVAKACPQFDAKAWFKIYKLQ